MLLFGFAVPALIAGTILRKVGVEAARANAYGSAAALAGRRKSGIGNWLNFSGRAGLSPPSCGSGYRSPRFFAAKVVHEDLIGDF